MYLKYSKTKLKQALIKFTLKKRPWTTLNKTCEQPLHAASFDKKGQAVVDNLKQNLGTSGSRSERLLLTSSAFFMKASCLGQCFLRDTTPNPANSCHWSLQATSVSNRP